MEKYQCPCGTSVRNRTHCLYLHFQTATHKYYLETGIKVTPIQIDENYPVGHWKRQHSARLRALRRYAQRKRDADKLGLTQHESDQKPDSTESLPQ